MINCKIKISLFIFVGAKYQKKRFVTIITHLLCITFINVDALLKHNNHLFRSSTRHGREMV